jgi:hypothetical protein
MSEPGKTEPGKTEPGKTDLMGDLRRALLSAREGIDALLTLAPSSVALEALRTQSPTDAAGFQALVEQVNTMEPQLKALATRLAERLERLEGLADSQQAPPRREHQPE